MKSMQKIGFGGGCHWCTEAVFLSLIGVVKVEQGWIASEGESRAFSEAVIVHFDTSLIWLEVLIEIHLRTHKSTSAHSMRTKYRSAIYTYDPKETSRLEVILSKLQPAFNEKLITQVLHFSAFKPSREEITNYYYKNPQKPFCETFINPKLKVLLGQFSTYTKTDALSHLKKTRATSKSIKNDTKI
jgi:peptide-methionine (S)-S-oxide reductase